MIFVMLVVGTAVLAKQPSGDLPVTTYLSDYNAVGTAYYVQSDGLGAYQNGVAKVTSILVGNGYNHITDGDWRVDMLSSTTRKGAVTFSTSNEVLASDPGYTAPANPPFWGTSFMPIRMETKCSGVSLDMLTMKPGDKFTCPASIRMPPYTSTTYYRLDMLYTFGGEPETQEPQVTCNSADSGGCNDWFIDPVPVVNADGSTSPGQSRARLVLVNTRGTSLNVTDEGDFYLTFHIHVTRP
jgi:hypothetical protein